MKYALTVNADHYQFYLEDVKVEHDYSLLWNKQQTHPDRMDVLPGLIAVSTGRYGGDVPVSVEVHETPPEDDNFDHWDHIIECSIEVRAGRLALTSPDDYGDNAATFDLKPGVYQARVYYGALDSVRGSAEMDGDDHYAITLWPGTSLQPRILKCKPRP